MANPELRISLRVHDSEIRDRVDVFGSYTATTTTTTTPGHPVGVGIRRCWGGEFFYVFFSVVFFSFFFFFGVERM